LKANPEISIEVDRYPHACMHFLCSCPRLLQSITRHALRSCSVCALLPPNRNKQHVSARNEAMQRNSQQQSSPRIECGNVLPSSYVYMTNTKKQAGCPIPSLYLWAVSLFFVMQILTLRIPALGATDDMKMLLCAALKSLSQVKKGPDSYHRAVQHV
jgi:hypothetical protein